MAKKGYRAAIVVAALGYFVDVYDLLIFSILRVASLKDLNVPAEELLSTGVYLLNMQMGGMLVGGIIWGILGDKRGRISVLLGSIFLYSIANIANSFAHSVDAYGVWRFIAGLGLAGELGAGITLVAELMPKESRGWGTTVVASVGVGGAVFAAIIGEYVPWRTAYIVGGVLGLALLTLRVAVNESGMFDSIKANAKVKRGDLRQLFSTRERLGRYLSCILVGLPIWYTIGILVTFSPEFGKAFGITETVSAGRAVMITYIGLVMGDFASGALSQVMRSRKKVLAIFIALNALTILYYLFATTKTATGLYAACFPMGFAVGYWAVFVTNAAEQFGTNLRATVTTTVPNFIRGSVVPITFFFEYLKAPLGIVNSALAVGSVCIAIAFFTLWILEEPFGKNLDYVEKV
jgi:MFS transporter, putative metabolite:H+ symporter